MVKHVMAVDFVGAVEQITGEARPDRSRDETPDERAARERAIAKRQKEIEKRKEAAERSEADEEAREAAEIERLLSIWRPIEGTHADAYLKARGLRPASSMTRDLGFVSELEYWGFANAEAKKLTLLATVPAMLARHRNAAGKVIGIRRTYLDPQKPTKFSPWNPPAPAKPRNIVKKMLGWVTGSLIRLGPMTEELAVAEGIETALAWHALGYGGDNLSLAAAGDLGNLVGKCTGSIPHPTRKHPDGRPMMMPNGTPNMDPDASGMILPEGVERLILIGDGDSEPFSTKMKLMGAIRRHTAEGIAVSIHMAPAGKDWNDVLLLQAGGA